MVSSKDKNKQPLACKQCGARSLYLVPLEDYFYLECPKGHKDRKYYGNKRGNLPKPRKIVRKLEDMLTEKQKELINLITSVINENEGFHRLSVPEQLKFLSGRCESSEKEIYLLCKLITVFQNASGGGIKNGYKI